MDLFHLSGAGSHREHSTYLVGIITSSPCTTFLNSAAAQQCSAGVDRETRAHDRRDRTTSNMLPAISTPALTKETGGGHHHQQRRPQQQQQQQLQGQEEKHSNVASPSLPDGQVSVTGIHWDRGIRARQHHQKINRCS